MPTGYQNSFTDRLSSTFLIRSLVNIPPHLKYVATLPCEIFMLENQRHPETLLVINPK